VRANRVIWNKCLQVASAKDGLDRSSFRGFTTIWCVLGDGDTDGPYIVLELGSTVTTSASSRGVISVQTL
jgi:hypothetical protein